jgi:hypothetical protein
LVQAWSWVSTKLEVALSLSYPVRLWLLQRELLSSSTRPLPAQRRRCYLSTPRPPS